jgi:hypothetical protein
VIKANVKIIHDSWVGGTWISNASHPSSENKTQTFLLILARELSFTLGMVPSKAAIINFEP